MGKTDKRLDEEIQAVDVVWNIDGWPGELDPIASAVCNALQWARGQRVPAPAEQLRRVYEAQARKKAGEG